MMNRWLKMSKAAIGVGALALVLIATSMQGLAGISVASALTANQVEFADGSTSIQEDVRRKGKRGGSKVKKGGDSDGFGTGGRRGRFD